MQQAGRAELVGIKNNYVTDNAGSAYNSYYYQNSNARSLKDLNFEINVSGKFTDKIGVVNFSVWLNDSIWVGLSGSHIVLFKNEQLTASWPVDSNQRMLIVKNGYIYLVNKSTDCYCININDKTITNTIAGNKSLFEDKAVLFYDKVNEQPLL